MLSVTKLSLAQARQAFTQWPENVGEALMIPREESRELTRDKRQAHHQKLGRTGISRNRWHVLALRLPCTWHKLCPEEHKSTALGGYLSMAVKQR